VSKLICPSGIWCFFLFILSVPAMSMEAKVKEEAFFNQEFPSAIVPGKIVFQSNRDGALSEIWIFENGKIRKIASDKKTDKNIPKQLPSSMAGMLGGAFGKLNDPKWSPDGKNILCLNSGKMIMLGEDENTPKKIETAKYVHSAVWSSLGGAVYYSAIDWLATGGACNIYKLNLNDKTERKITNIPPAPGVTSILSFTVSSDDKKIAMAIVGDNDISIWTINTDGSDFKMLIKYACEPAWSPDGTKIVYSSSVLPNGEKIPNQRNKIFVFDLETGKTTQITQKDWEDRNPIFSPDGTKIAFVSYRHRVITHGSEIFVINVDGTGEARLTPSQKNPKYPNDMFRGWSTDQYPDWHA